MCPRARLPISVRAASAVPAQRRVWNVDAMTVEEFRRSLGEAVPPAGLPTPLLALWWDARGDWNRAHEAAQAGEASTIPRIRSTREFTVPSLTCGVDALQQTGSGRARSHFSIPAGAGG